MTWHHVRCADGWEIRDDDGTIVATVHDRDHRIEACAVEIASARNAIIDALDAVEDWEQVEQNHAFLKRVGAWMAP